jgi:hypothetical protein
MPVVEKPAESRPEGRLPEKALVLTVATLILLTPPILTIFDVPLTIFGIPLLHVYRFAVWLAAIALGSRLANRMERRRDPTEMVPPASAGED